jgi:hypothetical protein
MNCKQIAACVLALGVTGIANAAQQGPGREAPDFVFNVPMNLKNIPGEVHTVVVWCEALNATYGSPGSREMATAGSDPNALQYRAGPQVIASTGAVLIPVGNARGIRSGTGALSDKPIPAWSVARIEGMSRTAPKPLSIRAGQKFSPQEMASLPSMAYTIIPGPGGGNPPTDLAVALTANTTGATDPALGTAYGCHMGFKATALIDGKPTDFDIFAGQGSYEGLPDENAKDAKFTEARGGAGGPNPAKILHVYGNFPPKDSKPAGK